MRIILCVFAFLINLLIIWVTVKSAVNSLIKEEPYKSTIKDIIREVIKEERENHNK